MEPSLRSAIARASRVFVVTCLIVVLTGCALSLSGPDPHRLRTQAPTCDTGKGAVKIDGVWSAAMGVTSLIAFSGEESGVGLATLAIGAAFLGSAIRGNNAVNDCQAAFEDYRNVIAAQQMQPQVDAAQELPRPRPRRRPRAETVEPQPAVAAPVRPFDPAPTPSAAPVPTPAPTPKLVEDLGTNAPPPAATKPAAPARPTTPATPTKPVPRDDDWSQFWREVP